MTAGAQTVASTVHVLRCRICWQETTIEAAPMLALLGTCPRCDGELIAVQLEPDNARPTVAQLRLNLDGQAAMFAPEENS